MIPEEREKECQTINVKGKTTFENIISLLSMWRLAGKDCQWMLVLTERKVAVKQSPIFIVSKCHPRVISQLHHRRQTFLIDISIVPIVIKSSNSVSSMLGTVFWISKTSFLVSDFSFSLTLFCSLIYIYVVSSQIALENSNLKYFKIFLCLWMSPSPPKICFIRDDIGLCLVSLAGFNQMLSIFW